MNSSFVYLALEQARGAIVKKKKNKVRVSLREKTCVASTTAYFTEQNKRGWAEMNLGRRNSKCEVIMRWAWVGLENREMKQHWRCLIREPNAMRLRPGHGLRYIRRLSGRGSAIAGIANAHGAGYLPDSRRTDRHTPRRVYMCLCIHRDYEGDCFSCLRI